MVEKRALIDCSIVSEDEAKHIRGLTIRREREIAEADRHRKSQIRNINQHYEFELSRAEGISPVTIPSIELNHSATIFLIQQ